VKEAFLNVFMTIPMLCFFAIIPNTHPGTQETTEIELSTFIE
jgi:hypothetical protein